MKIVMDFVEENEVIGKYRDFSTEKNGRVRRNTDGK